MNRRKFLALAAAPALAQPKRPNILLIISDQFRADALACAGNSFTVTPNLDALARGGVHFTNAYCPQALCTPCRGALLTGVFPHTNKLDHNLYNVANAFKMPEFDLLPNWPALLRKAGYYTGYIGKWHLGDDDPGLFDYWAGYNSLKPHWTGKNFESEYRTDVECAEAMKFLDANRAKPFALTVSWYPPHTPYVPPKKYSEMYQTKGVEHAAYYGAVTAVDAAAGRLLGHLKSLGLERDTLVIFTSDHGETFAQRPGSTNKTVCYDESAKVPMLIRWPARLPVGLRFEGGVSNLDLMPTMLEAAGIARPARLQGRSRLLQMLARDTGWKEPVFMENITQKKVEGEFVTERAVRTARWKLILRSHTADELFDLETDPGERTNLAAAQKERVRELAGLLRAWGERTGDAVSVGYAKRYL